MLTASTVLGTLETYLPRQKVVGILNEMARTGLVRPRPAEPFSPHNACVCMIGACLPYDARKALSAAMVARDWPATGPSEGRRLQLGIEPESIKDIKLIRALCSSVYCHEPVPVWVSEVETVCHGLRFSPGFYGDEVPGRIKRTTVALPAAVLAGFARHYGQPRENERVVNEQLLGRIRRSLRPERIAEAAE